MIPSTVAFPRKRESINSISSRVWITAFAGAILWMGITTPVQADSSLPPAPLAYTQLPDAKQEAKAKALMETLRCLVCQGQSIADSDAEMAGDMRALVRQKIAAGEAPDDIRAWLVARYGKWVSYDPPFDFMTAPIWIAPLLMLVIGIWLARGRFRKRH